MDWAHEFQKVYRYVAWVLKRPDLAADVAQMTLLQQLVLVFPCRRWLPDPSGSLFSRSRCLELVVDGVPHRVDLDDAPNDLAGVVRGIRQAKIGILPEIVEKGSKKNTNKQYSLRLLVASSVAESLELRETPGDPNSNMLDPVVSRSFDERLVATCRLIDWIRRQKEQQLPVEADADGNERPIEFPDAMRPNPEDTVVEAAELAGFYRSFRQLSANDRHILGKKFFLELTLEEIAATCRCSLSGVHAKLQAAMRRLRAIMSQDLPSRLIVAVEGGEFLSRGEQKHWLGMLEIVLGRLSEKDELNIYAIRHWGTGHKALFSGKIGTHGWRMQAGIAFEQAIAGASPDSIHSLFTVFDQIQRAPRWRTRVMLFVANTLPTTADFRWDKKLLWGVPVQIIPPLNQEANSCYAKLVRNLGATV